VNHVLKYLQRKFIDGYFKSVFKGDLDHDYTYTPTVSSCKQS
jgi:hypothetical protein